jgi:hypothetical protein
MKPTHTADTPLARRFADLLAAADPRRIRISLDAYAAAFLSAEPSLSTASIRRARLAAAIEELVDAGVISVSRTLDRSERPPLPRFVVLLDRTSDPPAADAAGYPWRPELAWAARLPLRGSEFEALRAIQVFLRDRGAAVPVVPAGERSLELFGDEKRLDSLRQNRRLFTGGRLSLDLLRARAYAPPFPYRRVSAGSVALVLENIATYHSVLATLPSGSPIGLVVFGGGANFAASVAYFAELAADGDATPVSQIHYFGDLDRRGLEIPLAADATARQIWLPAVLPAVKLWTELLGAGRRAPHRRVHAATADGLVAWLPVALRPAAHDVLVSGARLAQEAVGTERLLGDLSWASWEGLGAAATAPI